MKYAPLFEERFKAYYYLMKGDPSEKAHFQNDRSSYYVFSRSKRVKEYLITQDTDIQEMISKLGSDHT